jgi:pyruvate,orthophosphate dikinase
MFFDEDRIRAVREMILADNEEHRRSAIAKLLPMQRADFVELFDIMRGLPVTIRLLDPPLHEFLPHGEAEITEVAASMGADPKKLANRARELAEFNPMLGFRGCRIAIAYPEIAGCRRAPSRGRSKRAETGKPVVLK